MNHACRPRLVLKYVFRPAYSKLELAPLGTSKEGDPFCSHGTSETKGCKGVSMGTDEKCTLFSSLLWAMMKIVGGGSNPFLYNLEMHEIH